VKTKNLVKVIIAFSAMFALNACAIQPGYDVDDVETAGQSEIPITALSEPEPLESAGPTAPDAYRIIAEESCRSAEDEGVVETSNGFTVVSVPKEEAYEGFSAAYLEYPDTYQIIWELTNVFACSHAISFSMAQEAGYEADIEVQAAQEDNTFLVSEDFGEFGMFISFVKTDGLRIVGADSIDSGDPWSISIEYGSPSAENRNILMSAVNRYLSVAEE
jgi:hypothetical protein